MLLLNSSAERDIIANIAVSDVLGPERRKRSKHDGRHHRYHVATDGGRYG